MKVKIDKQTIKDYPAIWKEEAGIIHAIDQRVLPFRFEIFTATTLEDVCLMIKEMVVRGAPLIGVTAAYGLNLVAKQFQGKTSEEFRKRIKQAATTLAQTRPTAVDLFNAIDLIVTSISNQKSVEENKKSISQTAEKYCEAIIAECKKIGEVGNRLITKDISNIMTICNAGALATVDIGTALAPIRKAHEEQKNITVFVNETRPRVQGGRLTAWELENEGIDHRIIIDNAAGYLINKGKIDLVIVGADRVVRNGDIANKIGTYTLSVLCKENNVPFYVAAPKSTFDKVAHKGQEIIIEERASSEIGTIISINEIGDKKPKRRIIHNPNSPSMNPAFDITPAENISGIITPEGILEQPLAKTIKKYLDL